MRNSHAADWISDILPKFAQFSEIFAQVSKGRITKARLQAFIRDGGVPPTYELACSILKCDFITPEEVLAARNLVEEYTSEQFRQFDKTLPSEDILHWLRDNNYMLVAGPPKPMSLLDIFHLNPRIFCSSNGDRSTEEEKLKKLSCKDKVGTNWLTLRRGIGYESIFPKKRKEQLKMLSKEERVPNIAEAAWCFTTYKKVCMQGPSFDKFFRTSSTSSVSRKRNHIYIGFSNKGILHIDSCSDNQHDYHYIAVSRKI